MPFVKEGTGPKVFLCYSDRPWCNLNIEYLMSLKALLKYVQIIVNVICICLVINPEYQLVSSTHWAYFEPNIRPIVIVVDTVAVVFLGIGILYEVCVILCYVFYFVDDPMEEKVVWLRCQVFWCLLLCISYIPVGTYLLAVASYYYVNYYTHFMSIIMLLNACSMGCESYLLYVEVEEEDYRWFQLIDQVVRRESRFHK